MNHAVPDRYPNQESEPKEAPVTFFQLVRTVAIPFVILAGASVLAVRCDSTVFRPPPEQLYEVRTTDHTWTARGPVDCHPNIAAPKRYYFTDHATGQEVMLATGDTVIIRSLGKTAEPQTGEAP